MLHCENVTASSYGDIVKRRVSTSFGPLVMKLLYGQQWITPAIQYGHHNKPVARDAYIIKQANKYNRTVFTSKTGLHIGCLVRILCTCDICITTNFTIGQLHGWQLHQIAWSFIALKLITHAGYWKSNALLMEKTFL